MFGRSVLLLAVGWSLAAIPALAGEEDLNARLGRIRFGRSTLADVVAEFGEPASYTDSNGAYTKDNLPARYEADYPEGFKVRMANGVASSVEVRTSRFTLSCRLRVGDNLLDAIELVGHPSAIIVGAFPASFSDRTLYFENADFTGAAVFPDYGRGIRLRFTDAVVVSIELVNQRSNQGWIPPFTEASSPTEELDLRGSNMCAADLRDRLPALLHSQFDERTVWPPHEMRPPEFDPAAVVRYARDPGLGVRTLHEQGIDGRGVSIAIIDSMPRIDHAEYADRLRHIEWVGGLPSFAASYHGGLVTSLAAGSTIGVAPKAGIYYFIAPYTYDGYASAIRRIIELNRTLPEQERIRAISISWGWRPGDPAAAPWIQAIRDANDEGIFVVSVTIVLQQGYSIFGMGREPLADPNDFASYRPGLFMQQDFFTNPNTYANQFWVPMDARLMAGQNSADSYIFYRVGGLSDAIPWFAGLYALACQVNPGMTPALMKSAAMQTARNVDFAREGKNYTLRGVIDPVALIEAVRTQ